MANQAKHQFQQCFKTVKTIKISTLTAQFGEYLTDGQSVVIVIKESIGLR